MLALCLGVSPGWLVDWGFSLPLFDLRFPCFSFSVVLVCSRWRPPTYGEHALLILSCRLPLLVPCPLLMLVLRPSVVCFVFSVAMRRVVLFLFFCFLLVLPRVLCFIFLFWVCVGGSLFFLSLLAQRVRPKATGAAAACTPNMSFFSLSRPLVLLLVVGPFFVGIGW